MSNTVYNLVASQEVLNLVKTFSEDIFNTCVNQDAEFSGTLDGTDFNTYEVLFSNRKEAQKFFEFLKQNDAVYIEDMKEASFFNKTDDTDIFKVDTNYPEFEFLKASPLDDSFEEFYGTLVDAEIKTYNLFEDSFCSNFIFVTKEDREKANDIINKLTLDGLNWKPKCVFVVNNNPSLNKLIHSSGIDYTFNSQTGFWFEGMKDEEQETVYLFNTATDVIKLIKEAISKGIVIKDADGKEIKEILIVKSDEKIYDLISTINPDEDIFIQAEDSDISCLSFSNETKYINVLNLLNSSNLDWKPEVEII